MPRVMRISHSRGPQTASSRAEPEPIPLENASPQLQSPLFNRIPGEIRDRILEFVLAEYDDHAKPYQPNTWFYRPGFHYHRKMETAVLRTCRRIYFENRHLPLRQAELVMWAYRGPTAYRDPCHDIDFILPKMTKTQKESVQSIHYFTQQLFLEGNMPVILSWSGLYTKKLKITIRHQDWWNWEGDAPIAINPFRSGRAGPDQLDPPEQHHPGAWGNHIKNINGLQEFEMELETLARKKNQLDSIVSRARKWEFKLAGDQTLRNTSVKQWSWEGLVLSHVTAVAVYQAPGNGQGTRDEDELENQEGRGAEGPVKQAYYVVSMVWKPQVEPAKAQ